MYGGNYNNFKGSKYDEAKIQDIPKLVKQYIAKEYPNVKVSVTRQNYNSINVTIKELPYNPYTPEFLAYYERTDGGRIYEDNRFIKRYNQRFNEMEEKIKRFSYQYNHDYSDSQTDYFDKRFYFFIDIDYDYERELLKGRLKSPSKKDLETKELLSDANHFTKDNTKQAVFTYVDTSKGRRYYTFSGLPIKKALLEFMNSNGYKYTLEKKRW